MKKTSFLAFVLSLVLLLQCVPVPVSAMDLFQTVPEAETEAEETAPTRPSKLPFGTVSIHNGCRTIEAGVPLGTTERLLETAQGVVLFETTTNTMVYSYNPDMKLSPGSMTKVVLALVAIEQCDDLDEMVTVHSRNISRLPPGSIHEDMKEQEKISMRDLLYCVALHQANDACIAIAEHVSGNMQGFLVLMNDRVRQLGCTSTEFGNVHGLDNTTQYTTARDMAKIIMEASRNETFCEIFGTAKHTVPETNRSDARPLTTTNYMIDESIVPQFYTTKVKYGMQTNSDASGASMFTVSEDANKKMKYIGVVLGAQRVFQDDGWRVKSYGNLNEMLDLLEYGFDKFKVRRLIYDGQSLNQFSVIGGESEAVGQAKVDVNTVLPIHCQMDNLEMRYSVTDGSLTAPVKRDDMISTLEVWYRNSCVTEVELYAMSDVKDASETGITISSLEKKTEQKGSTGWSIMGSICIVVLSVGVAYIAFMYIRRKRMEARRRKRRSGRRRSY